jgi:hypothetical protein
VISQYGNFSSDLTIAHDLVQQNYKTFLQRTGNKIISDETEARLEERKLKRHVTNVDEVAEMNHYRATTFSLDKRFTLQQKRFHSSTNTLNKSLSMTKTKEKIHTKAENLALTMGEILENEAIEKSMTFKLSYLKNPRNNPQSVSKMLIKDDTFNEMKKSQAKKSVLKDTLATCPLFISEPNSVEFSHYNNGDVLTRKVVFRNVSTTSRYLQVSLIGSHDTKFYFKLSGLQYPVNCHGGLIAPGMSVSAELSFMPDSRGMIITMACFHDERTNSIHIRYL